MQKLLNAFLGVWGSFKQLPLTTQAASGVFTVLVVTLGVLNFPSSLEPANTITEFQKVNLATQTVGAESEAFATFASWPGEIISPNDADVQPPRQGTVVSWNVTIGEYVNAGEVLGRLSAAPLTPELATTLAERAGEVARAKSKLSSTQSFVGQSKTQLTIFTTNDTAERAISEAKQAAIAAGETAKGVLRQSVVKEFSEFSGNNRDILSSKDATFLTTLPWWFGVTNSSLRDKYLTATAKVVSALEKDSVSQQEGLAYFLVATQLAAASISSGEGFTQAELNDLRELISEHQASFNEAVGKYREALLTVSEKEKEFAERNRDNANKNTELDRDQLTAEAEYEAAQAAYGAASRAITGGTAIIAPKSGYVSAILGQIGEFVEPGKTVASISSGVQINKLIRFRIPSNVEVPKKGETVKVIRPGFAKDVRTATIIGVGTALDGNGAFMADARVEGELEWPAHLSVRIVPEKRTSQTIVVPFDAVFWDEVNHPHVWMVKEGGLVTSQAVKTGRTFGDAVEILEGLTLGDTYIREASDTITEGMRIEDAAITEQPATAPGGDGHGHAHDE
ncbi:hypothetical protein EPO14_01950 [Patescibacteria group bacterium]|nr:MAG: hypothetical protein EPO14_01950 [Patescibacteria group bacterium]